MWLVRPVLRDIARLAPALIDALAATSIRPGPRVSARLYEARRFEQRRMTVIAIWSLRHE